MRVISSPRPPLNLFEAVRKIVSGSVLWTDIYDVPQYLIPAVGIEAERSITAASIMTGLLLTNPGLAPVKASVQISNELGSFMLVSEMAIPPNDFAVISLDRQVMLSGEKLQVLVEPDMSLVVHFTFILNQREEYTSTEVVV